MGLRVRIVLVILLLLAVVALAVPLALSMSDRRTAALAAERDRHLAALTDAAAMPGIPLQPLVDRYYDVYAEGLLIVDADGRTLASRGLDISTPGVQTAADHALVAAPVSPWSRILPWDGRRPLATSAIRRDGELIGAAVLAVDTGPATSDVAKGWLWIGAGCLAFLLLAAVVARMLTRWVLRPLDGLERAVAEMTEGVAGPPANVAGPPELRHFTSAFNTMAQVVRASLDRQRRLVADASHQMRNPLAAVRLRADTLESYVAEEGRSTYDSMTSELDRFENLLQQLLRLARAEQVSGSRKVGLSTAAAEVADLGDVIAERLTFWEPLAAENEQRLCNRSDPVGLAVQVPRHEVEQLLDVALDNAVRYAGSDATITVSAARVDNASVELAISDTGSGLPEEDLPRAASRFWRGRDSGSGTGLGLAIASEIAQGHGGRIEVHRAREGGLLIRYVLPATDEPAS
ncbi:HAMP domain-containing sensor histidine kinase [Mycobacterium sp. URHD0025]|uniref:sensor histidine kinase n=1 Tax=Mycobacterium sp. URHD0025 TaxID=1298864 RepID=UPI000407BCB5|nr:HAMP domain-containing sensor histidine kinase [Mycobacterium sp. URHD0025]